MNMMILLDIILAAGMLWIGFMGIKRKKETGAEEGGSSVFHIMFAAFGGMVCIFGVAGIGGEMWSLILGAVVYIGILYYFLIDEVRRSKKKIAHLEKKIDDLASCLLDEEKL